MLRGTKTSLRAVEEGDLPLLQQWLQDPALSFSRGSRRMVRGTADMLDWFDALREREGDPFEGLSFAILDGRDRLVGLAETGPMDPVDRQVEISLFIGRPEDRRKGHGREALRLLVRHCVEDLGVHKLRTLVVAEDTRAVAYNLAIGFVEEGRLRQHRFLQGGWRDMLAMGLLADEAKAAWATS